MRQPIIKFDQYSRIPLVNQQLDGYQKSKYSTPKRAEDYKQMNEFQHRHQYSETLTKQTGYLNTMHNTNKAKDVLNRKLIIKIQEYQILSKTLKEYFKQQSKNNKNSKQGHNKAINLTVNMLKAFTKTQLSEISPHLTELVHDMLNTLPLSNAKEKKKKKLVKQQDINEVSQSIRENDKKHSRQFSFAREKVCQVKIEDETKIKSEIEELQLNLIDLKQQEEVLKQIRSQFQQMTHKDKKQYIAQLQQIIQNQQKILDDLNSQI